MTMLVPERNLGRLLSYSGAGLSLAVLLALAAAHFYRAPNLSGLSDGSWWLDPDSLCSAASGGVALLVAWLAGQHLVRTRNFGQLLIHTLCWFGLMACLFALWAHFLFLLTLLIAPSHAFAVMRLVLLWRAWRAEVAWQAE